eukprot:TRINITY_DN1084_c0_g2_i2.p1 TRINITY_DN1084_c0_g2~~TRINITY_DN1084_c0_g2_i2.p1  ORF type:complete len:494 (-),score=77.57 TRINITY_DN1084_c0_g2_i2:76-1557(-)
MAGFRFRFVASVAFTCIVSIAGVQRKRMSDRMQEKMMTHPKIFAPSGSEAALFDAAGATNKAFQNLVFSQVIYSNLGGLGPDTSSPSGIRYGNVTTLNGAEIDMTIVAGNGYKSPVPFQNGVKGKLASVDVQGNSSVEFTVTFLKAGTDETVELGAFFFSVLDIDKGIYKGKDSCAETLTIGGFSDYLLNGATDIEYSQADGLSSFKASGKQEGTLLDNPVDPMMLTELQAKRTVSFKFPAGLSTFKFNYSVTENQDVTDPQRARRGRWFFLGGLTAEYFCKPEVISLNFGDAKIERNNLGGHGPEKNKPHGLLYGNVATFGSQKIDVLVTNLTEYKKPKKKWDPKSGSYGQISVRSGSTTRFQFRMLKSGTNQPFELDWVYFSLYDLDSAEPGKKAESFEIDNFVTHYLTETTELNVKNLGGGRYRYESTTAGTGKDNPTDPMTLTQQQSDRAATFLFHKASGFTTTLEISPPKKGQRAFQFGGKSEVVYCK